jgi:EAL domain-containing protein (putative c-di-GMP-specific phosphodiesterase class I)
MSPATSDPKSVLALAQTVKEEIRADRVALVFQPIVSLRGDPAELYEVRVALEDPEGNRLPSAEVLKEDIIGPDLLVALDARVLERSIALIAERQVHGHDTHLFVKLSGASAKRVDTPLTVSRCLNHYQLTRQRLVIEIIDATVVTDPGAARALTHAAHQLGCRTAIGHFQNKPASMQLLRHGFIDYLKFDASVVQELRAGRVSASTVQSVVEQAHALNKQTVAEGIEDADTLRCMFESDIDFAQGYYVQEPSYDLGFEFSIGLGPKPSY